jgi:hypothetical protein
MVAEFWRTKDQSVSTGDISGTIGIQQAIQKLFFTGSHLANSLASLLGIPFPNCTSSKILILLLPKAFISQS